MASISRLERFGTVGSTQDIVRAWLADGVPEICVAVADEQSAGRGRLDRSWVAPPGRALLVSAGSRPIWLAPEHGWRLGAIVAMAMLDAVADVHGMDAADLGLGLKWPNDIVVQRGDRILKVGGVLGETLAKDGRLEAAIVGLGVNADWSRDAFPQELAATMSSLSEVTGARVDRERLLAAWLERLRDAYTDLDAGRFPGERWAARQVTTGTQVEVDLGAARHVGTAIGMDPDGGGLVVRGRDGVIRTHLSGEVIRCRVGGVEAEL